MLYFPRVFSRALYEYVDVPITETEMQAKMSKPFLLNDKQAAGPGVHR